MSLFSAFSMHCVHAVATLITGQQWWGGLGMGMHHSHALHGHSCLFELLVRVLLGLLFSLHPAHTHVTAQFSRECTLARRLRLKANQAAAAPS